MGTAFLCEDVVTEAQDILLKGIHKLDGRFHLNPVHRALKINGVMYRSLARIQFLYIGNDALRLMVGNLLILARPLILIADGQHGIQVGCLMKAAFQPFGLEPGLLKNIPVRKEINPGACLPGLAHNGKQPILKFDDGLSLFVFVMVDITVPVHLYVHVL